MDDLGLCSAFLSRPARRHTAPRVRAWTLQRDDDSEITHSLSCSCSRLPLSPCWPPNTCVQGASHPGGNAVNGDSGGVWGLSGLHCAHRLSPPLVHPQASCQPQEGPSRHQQGACARARARACSCWGRMRAVCVPLLQPRSHCQPIFPTVRSAPFMQGLSACIGHRFRPCRVSGRVWVRPRTLPLVHEHASSMQACICCYECKEGLPLHDGMD